MSILRIPGLASYGPGIGFGSSVVRPQIPHADFLHGFNFFGTDYAGVEDDGNLYFHTDVADRPSGITMVSDGIQVEGGLSAAARVVLPHMREPWEGTWAFTVTLSSDTTGTTDRGRVISNTSPSIGLYSEIRWRNSAGPNAAVGPFTHIQSIENRFNRGSNSAGTANSGAGIPNEALNLNEPLMVVVTKRVSDGLAECMIFQGDFYHYNSTAITYLSEGWSGVVTFGTGANMSGPNKLHSAGVWLDKILTPAEAADLWQQHRDVFASLAAS